MKDRRNVKIKNQREGKKEKRKECHAVRQVMSS
jgi:hypothetical protein